MKKTNIMTSADARHQMFKLGIPVDIKKIYLCRLGIRKGHGTNELGVCFVYDYYGIRPPQGFWEYLKLSLGIQRRPQNWVIYVKAFSGSTSRDGKWEIMEQTVIKQLFDEYTGFKAHRGSWKFVNGEIVSFDDAKRQQMM